MQTLRLKFPVEEGAPLARLCPAMEESESSPLWKALWMSVLSFQFLQKKEEPQAQQPLSSLRKFLRKRGRTLMPSSLKKKKRGQKKVCVTSCPTVYVHTAISHTLRLMYVCVCVPPPPAVPCCAGLSFLSFCPSKASGCLHTFLFTTARCLERRPGVSISDAEPEVCWESPPFFIQESDNEIQHPKASLERRQVKTCEDRAFFPKCLETCLSTFLLLMNFMSCQKRTGELSYLSRSVECEGARR